MGATKSRSAEGSKIYTQLTGPQGKVYLVEDGNLGKLQTVNTGMTTTTTSFAGLVTNNIPHISSDNETEWKEWMATIEEEKPTASLDWKDYSRQIQNSKPAMVTQNESALTITTDNSFFIDSGATVHISPYKADFLTFQPISPKSVKGVGGSTIQAHGMGTIILRTLKGNSLKLEKALYIPNSTIRLISISQLAKDNHAFSRFDK